MTVHLSLSLKRHSIYFTPKDQFTPYGEYYSSCENYCSMAPLSEKITIIMISSGEFQLKLGDYKCITESLQETLVLTIGREDLMKIVVD